MALKHEYKKNPDKGDEVGKNREGKRKSLPPHSHVKAVSYFPLVAAILFFVVAWLLLTLFRGDFLYRIQELSLFLPTRMFFTDMMEVPAGFLSYVGAFLTQFFYYPWLGALLLSLSWVAVLWMTAKAFGLPAKYFFVAFVPVLLLVACSLELGHWMYILKQPGYMFVAPVGFLCAMTALWVFKRLSHKGKLVFIPLWIFAGCYLFGIYALIGGLCMALSALKGRGGVGAKSLTVAMAALFLIAVPLLWYALLLSFRIDDAYTMGVPPFFDEVYDNRRLTVFYLLYAFAPVCAIFAPANYDASVKRPCINLLFQTVAVALCLLGTMFWWEGNPNFYREIEMQNAIERCDWEAVLEAKDKQQGEPSRMMVLYRNLALAKLHRGGNEMFTYKNGSETPDTSVPLQLVTMGGTTLFYHYAHYNMCYRWCVENSVEYGWKNEYLKYAVKCAILSGEKKLAQRFLDTLKKTWFQRGWALRYEAFLNDSESIKQDEEFASILPLHIFIDQMVGEASTGVDYYLYNFYGRSNPEASNALFDEVSMMSLLSIKELGVPFGAAIMRYINTHKKEPLPLYYQQALLLASFLKKKNIDDVKSLPPALKKDFMNFMQKAKAVDGASKEKIEKALYPYYGQSYYYYYFFENQSKNTGYEENGNQ